MTPAGRGIITFMSDFGFGDWCVAAVKGEILKRAAGISAEKTGAAIGGTVRGYIA